MIVVVPPVSPGIILVSIWTFSPCFRMDIDANDVPTQVSYQKGGGRGHNEEVDQFVLACKEPYNAESKLQFVFKFQVFIMFAFRKRNNAIDKEFQESQQD